MFANAKVRDWMTSQVISVAPDTSIRSAYRLMKDAGIRHLPIVADNQLVGILSSGDIREASPSDATSLSIWELNYLWDKLTVERAMTRHVLTVQEDNLIVDALRLMLDNKFSSLPVLDAHHKLVGILTETDIFRLVLHEAESLKDAV
jgi:CBS domain-containing protein